MEGKSYMSEPVVAQKSPFGVEVEAGRDYWWCACGRSGNQPFCDGSHKGTGFGPAQYTAAEAETVWFCGCKHTDSVPLCDGSHKNV